MGLRFDKVDPRLWADLGTKVGTAYVQNKAADAYAAGIQQQSTGVSNYGKVDPNAAYTGEGTDGAMTNAEAASYGVNVPVEDKAAGTGVVRQYGLGVNPQKFQDTEFTPEQRRTGGLKAQADFYAARGDTDTSNKIMSQVLQDERQAAADARDNTRFGWEQDAQPLRQRTAELQISGAERVERQGVREDQWNDTAKGLMGAWNGMTEEDKSAFAKKHSYDVGVKASISWAPGDKPGAGSGYVLPENGSPPIKVSDAEMGQMFMLSQMMQVDPVRANKELASASTSVRAVAKEVFDMNIKTSELGLRVQTQNETARHNKAAESNDSARTGILGRSAEYRVPRSVSQETYTAMNAISVELDDPGTTPDRRKVLEAGYRRLEGVAANELGRALQRDRVGPGVLEKPPLDFKDFTAGYGDTPVPGLGTTGKKRVLRDLPIDQQYWQYQQFIQSTRGASDGAGAPVVAPPPRNAGGPAKPEGARVETPRNAAPRTPQERTNDEMLRRQRENLGGYGLQLPTLSPPDLQMTPEDAAAVRRNNKPY